MEQSLLNKAIIELLGQGGIAAALIYVIHQQKTIYRELIDTFKEAIKSCEERCRVLQDKI